MSYDINYMWNLTKWYKWTYSQGRNRLTDIGNKLMVTKKEREWEGETNEEFGISRSNSYR